MYVNNKKITINQLKENGKIIEIQNKPNNKGLGDSDIYRVTFENNKQLDIEILAREYSKEYKQLKELTIWIETITN